MDILDDKGVSKLSAKVFFQNNTQELGWSPFTQWNCQNLCTISHMTTVTKQEVIVPQC